MNDPNRAMKWFLIIGLVVISLIVLYPPERTLKGGIDLVGGTSMLFEIDSTGLDSRQIQGLSTKVMGILKERVDPQSQLNLEWRPVGNTRLEIRMPRPPSETIARREAKDGAIERIRQMNLQRFEVETALESPESNRAKELQGLHRGIPERAALLDSLQTAYAAKSAAQKETAAPAPQASAEAYEKSMSDLLATNLPVDRLVDVLGLGRKQLTKREAELANLRKQHPAFDAASDGKPGAISTAVQAFDQWIGSKTDLEDASDLKRRLRGAGVLEFRILAERDPASPGNTRHASNPALVQPISGYAESLSKYGPRAKGGDRYVWLPVKDVFDFMHITKIEDFETQKNNPVQPIVEEYSGRYFALAHGDTDFGLLRSNAQRRWQLKTAFPDQDPMSGANVVSFVLDSRGGQLFRELTGTNVNRQLCIVLDDEAMSHATINEAIGERCQIRGQFSLERVNELVNTLQAGALPARLKETPLSEQTTGPSLGKSNRERGIAAAAWSSIALLIFVFFYYGFAGGGIANLALALNLLFTLAILAVMQATFTLPGIAGLILTVGMAIDANVLIFERIREERARGIPLRKALNAGYDKAFSAILDGNLTTMITCIILAFLGSQEIKGFGITLGLGLATSMFTALTVTRLIFNTLIAKGMLHDLKMRKLIGVPTIDWIGLRRIFWPISLVGVIGGIALFLGMSLYNKETIYDIEFLGGTSVQIELKPNETLTDEQVTELITGGRGKNSAVQWLQEASGKLDSAKIAETEQPSRYSITAAGLTGDQLVSLVRFRLEGALERNGIRSFADHATFDAKPGETVVADFQTALRLAIDDAKDTADRMRRARVQVVENLDGGEKQGPSFEIVTTATNRGVVQASIVAALGDKLSIQRARQFSVQRDEELTREPFFVIEASDQYLSEVLATDANYQISSFRGGVAIDFELAAQDEPMTKEELESRIRQAALQPEFEQLRTRESKVIGIGATIPRPDGKSGFRRFAVLAADPTIHYDDNPELWADSLARPQMAITEAALNRERSLSKVVQFAPQVAAQTKQKAVFALALSFVAIAAYVWIRFGTKDYGLAVLVALVHDVTITLGALALSNLVFDNPLGNILLLEDFKVDLPIIAAILTIIGYSLNDTIVVFDRIRENRGRAGDLSAPMINGSINQTLSRTILTSFTVFLVMMILYVFGGTGIHGFSFALLIGVMSGTYSTVAIAVPLVYRPVVLRTVVWVIVAFGLVGMIFAVVDHSGMRWVLSLLSVVGCFVAFHRTTRSISAAQALQPAM